MTRDYEEPDRWRLVALQAALRVLSLGTRDWGEDEWRVWFGWLASGHLDRLLEESQAPVDSLDR